MACVRSWLAVVSVVGVVLVGAGVVMIVGGGVCGVFVALVVVAVGIVVIEGVIVIVIEGTITEKFRHNYLNADLARVSLRSGHKS